MCMAIATAVQALRLQPERGRGERWVEISLGAVLAVMLALACGTGRLSSPGAWSPRQYAWSIENRRPRMDAALSTALATAGVLPTDPIVFAEWGYAWGQRPALPERAWLPIKPFLLFAPLATERKKVYLSRFVDRVGLGGWFVAKRSSQVAIPWRPPKWIADQLTRTHVAAQVRAWRVESRLVRPAARDRRAAGTLNRGRVRRPREAGGRWTEPPAIESASISGTLARRGPWDTPISGVVRRMRPKRSG